ncbi:MAG: hypothetical protein ACTJGR_06065 [Pauljensenia sp.]
MSTHISDLVAIRHGCRLQLPSDLPWWEQARVIHDARLEDALASMTGAVAVLQSAVLVHGGMLRHVTDQAHVRVGWNRSLRRHPRGRLWDLPREMRHERLSRRPVVNHRMTFDEGEVTEVGGIRVTDLSRTTLDAARFLAPDDAFVATESLLAAAAGRDRWWRDRVNELKGSADGFRAILLNRLDDMRGLRGVAQARDILTLASPLSESAWESELRRIALAAGYADLEPQVKVRTRRGTRWVDIGHARMRRGLEVNGDIKYDSPRGQEVIRAEQARLEELADAGFRARPLSVGEVQDTAKLLQILDEDFGESRHASGHPRLWTPGERNRYSSL